MARLAIYFSVLEEVHRIDMRAKRRRQGVDRFFRAAMDVTDDQFVGLYRLSKELFNELVIELTPFMKTPYRRGEASINCKILLALSFYASGSYQRMVGMAQTNVLSQPSVSRCIKEVTEALNQVAILKKHIYFPGTLQERNSIKRKFFEKYQIPGVVGCVDGTHVAMVRPSRDEEQFFNRKHFHSRNVQIICDFDMNITSVDASFGGATHDSHIFNQHPVKQHLRELVARGETVHLLGDSGYALRPYMLTPIVDAAAGSAEEYFTKTHCAARNRVERTIGLLKCRWRCLLKDRVLHYDPKMVAKIVNACCVLHNMCNRSRLPSPDMGSEYINQEPHFPTSLKIQSRKISKGARKPGKELYKTCGG